MHAALEPEQACYLMVVIIDAQQRTAVGHRLLQDVFNSCLLHIGAADTECTLGAAPVAMRTKLH